MRAGEALLLTSSFPWVKEGKEVRGKETETDGLSVLGSMGEFRNEAISALLSQSVNYPGDLWSRERKEAFNHEGKWKSLCFASFAPVKCSSCGDAKLAGCFSQLKPFLSARLFPGAATSGIILHFKNAQIVLPR